MVDLEYATGYFLIFIEYAAVVTWMNYLQPDDLKSSTVWISTRGARQPLRKESGAADILLPSNMGKDKGAKVKPADDLSSDLDGSKTETTTSQLYQVVNVIATIFSFVFPILIPTVIISIYRSDYVTDVHRVVFVCLLIPLLREFNLQMARLLAKKEIDLPGPCILSKTHWQSHTIATWTFLRRFCLSAMRDQSIALLAIVLSGVEEAVDRCGKSERERKRERVREREREEQDSNLQRRQVHDAVARQNLAKVDGAWEANGDSRKTS